MSKNLDARVLSWRNVAEAGRNVFELATIASVSFAALFLAVGVSWGFNE